MQRRRDVTHNQDLEVVHKGQVAGEDEGQAVGHQGEGREARNHPSVDQEAGHQTIGPEKEHQEKGLIAVPGRGLLFGIKTFCL